MTLEYLARRAEQLAEVYTRRVSVGSVASLEITMPVIELGNGEPVLSILCGLHGDEPLGLLACHGLLQRLSEVACLSGTVRILPVTNPLAQVQETRVSSIDYLDQNRLSRGNSQGSLSERQAATIFEIVKKSTVVIDLHEFQMRTPLMAILLRPCEPRLEERVLSNIAAFAPELVWVMKSSYGAESQYSQSMIAALMQEGVPAFGVETSHGAGPSELKRLVSGLWRVACRMGIVDGCVASLPPTLAVRRQAVSADHAGVWKPSKPLMQRVSSQQVIGSLTSVDYQTREDIVAGGDGLLIQCLADRVVHTGMNLFALGLPDDEICGLLAEVTTCPV